MRKKLEQLAEERGIEFYFADGFDDAIVGLTNDGENYNVVYSQERCLQCLVKDGMDQDEAHEYLEYNVFNAFYGPSSPVYIETLDDY